MTEENRHILGICAALEIAARNRVDVLQVHIGPVSEEPRWIEAHFKLNTGIESRQVSTMAKKLLDGRSYRGILNDWLGPEPDNHLANQPIMDSFPPTLPPLPS